MVVEKQSATRKKLKQSKFLKDLISIYKTYGLEREFKEQLKKRMNSRSLRERKLYGVVDYELMSTIINSSPNIEKVEEKPFQEKIKRYKAERNLIPFLKKISKTFIDNEEGFGDFIKQQILVRRGYNDQWKLLYVNSYNFPSSQLGSIVNSLLYKGAKNSGEFITSVLKKIK